LELATSPSAETNLERPFFYSVVYPRLSILIAALESDVPNQSLFQSGKYKADLKTKLGVCQIGTSLSNAANQDAQARIDKHCKKTGRSKFVSRW